MNWTEMRKLLFLFFSVKRPETSVSASTHSREFDFTAEPQIDESKLFGGVKYTERRIWANDFQPKQTYGFGINSEPEQDAEVKLKSSQPKFMKANQPHWYWIYLRRFQLKSLLKHKQKLIWKQESTKLRNMKRSELGRYGTLYFWR